MNEINNNISNNNLFNSDESKYVNEKIISKQAIKLQSEGDIHNSLNIRLNAIELENKKMKEQLSEFHESFNEMERLKNNEIKSLNNSSNHDNNFSLLFTNIGESKKLLKSYEIFINKYFETINSYYKELTEFNFHFLIEDKFKSSVINSPIFQLGRAIKKAVQAQINNLFSIITNQEIFLSFKKAISDLSQILKESPVKFRKNSYSQNAENSYIKPVVMSLMESFSEIETKVIDEYIEKKYKRRVVGLNNEPLKDIVEKAIFLENTFLEFEEGSKKQLLSDLEKTEIKITQIFNEMKGIVKKIVIILKKNNNSYLDELGKEIDQIGKIESINRNNENINVRRESSIDFNNDNNLDMLKYRIKIINHPKIQVVNINPISNIRNNIENKGEEKESKKKYEDIEDYEKNKNIFDLSEDKIEEKDSKSENIKLEDDKEENNNDNEMTLNEEDIFNIVSSLYNYDFKMLNKSDYNLDIEKIRIKVLNLSNKLLTFDAENKINEIITDEEINSLYELLDKKEYIFNFFVSLNNYRITGRYEATERAFNVLTNIFKKAEDYLLNTRDMKLEGLIIILSQTFYIMKNGEKIYLQKAIKDHPLFKKKEFWENYIIDMIKEEIMGMNEDEAPLSHKLSDKIEKNKINEIIFSKLVPISSYMNDFEVKEEIILNIANNILDKYQVNEETKKMILSIIEKKS